MDGIETGNRFALRFRFECFFCKKHCSFKPCKHELENLKEKCNHFLKKERI